MISHPNHINRKHDFLILQKDPRGIYSMFFYSTPSKRNWMFSFAGIPSAHVSPVLVAACIIISRHAYHAVSQRRIKIPYYKLWKHTFVVCMTWQRVKLSKTKILNINRYPSVNYKCIYILCIVFFFFIKNSTGQTFFIIFYKHILLLYFFHFYTQFFKILLHEYFYSNKKLESQQQQ